MDHRSGNSVRDEDEVKSVTSFSILFILSVQIEPVVFKKIKRRSGQEIGFHGFKV